jgi:hypothetical protein
MVRRPGLEPGRLSTYAPQTYVSTNSTTPALRWEKSKELRESEIIGSKLKSQAEKIGSAFELQVTVAAGEFMDFGDQIRP